MKKLILFSFLIISIPAVYSQTAIEGTYMIGDKKAFIKMDDYVYYLSFEGEDGGSRLAYEENNLENDQIWTVWRKGNQQASIIFENDYSAGTYSDYRTDRQFPLKKIE